MAPRMGPDANKTAIPILIDTLKDDDENVGVAAAGALAEMCRAPKFSKFVVDSVIHALKDEHKRARTLAAQLLRYCGTDAAAALPSLIDLLGDNDVRVRQAAAQTLGKIALALRQAGRTDSIEELRAAEGNMQNSPDIAVNEHANEVTAAVDLLDARMRQIQPGRLHRLIREYPLILLLIVAYATMALVCFGLLWISPFSLFRINNVLSGLPKLKLPTLLGGIERAFSDLIIVGFLHYHPRVLDAWVSKNLCSAENHFQRITTVKGTRGSCGSARCVRGQDSSRLHRGVFAVRCGFLAGNHPW